MDAFFAAVEIRDDPSLKGKPVIIGSLPNERGVVSTCSYEARKFGVHSAMNIKEAYRLCPEGIYIHPNMLKYKRASDQIHRIWGDYTDVMESIAFDEAYLDVTHTAGTFERAIEMGTEIKERIRNDLGLSCSVGVAYSMAAAKVASEEKKPDGFFVIRTQQEFVDLVLDRDIRILFSVGAKTADRMNSIGIYTVRDLLERQDDVLEDMGDRGRFYIDIASGIDDREVTPYNPEDAKSISRELTFQEDVTDRVLLKDVLLLLSMCVEDRAKAHGLHGSGAVLKITYSDMKGITRSRVTYSCEDALSIHRQACEMLEETKVRPVRLIGVGIYNLSQTGVKQATLDTMFSRRTEEEELKEVLRAMRKRYGFDFVAFREKYVHGTKLHKLVEDMRLKREYGFDMVHKL